MISEFFVRFQADEHIDADAEEIREPVLVFFVRAGFPALPFADACLIRPDFLRELNLGEPFASIGANIGLEQKYTRIYTERLIRYLSGEDMGQ
jgi:hypothetical protein